MGTRILDSQSGDRLVAEYHDLLPRIQKRRPNVFLFRLKIVAAAGFSAARVGFELLTPIGAHL